MRNHKRRVVITGIGAISPIGITAEEIENSLRSSISGVKPISLFDASALPVRFAGEASSFRPEDHLDVKEIRRNDRFIQMCLAATEIAIKNSGVHPDKLKSAGVAIGVGLGGLYSIESAALELEKSETKKSARFLFHPFLQI